MGKKRLRNDFEEDTSTDVDCSPKHKTLKKTTETTASVSGPPTPILVSANGRSSSPNSTTQPKKAVQKNILKDDTTEAELTTSGTTSPEAKLLKKLKELSKMKPSIERCLQVTGSVNLLELFSSSDSKSQDAWKKAGRGVLLLKEGLKMVTQAEDLLSS